MLSTHARTADLRNLIAFEWIRSTGKGLSMRACDRERQSSRTCWTDIRRCAAQSATVQMGSDVTGLHDTGGLTEGTASNGSLQTKKNLKRRKSYFFGRDWSFVSASKVGGSSRPRLSQKILSDSLDYEHFCSQSQGKSYK